MNRMVLWVVVALAVAGCTPHVQSTVTVFQNLPTKATGETVAIIPGKKEMEGTLEFRAYSDKLADHLRAAGYTVTDISPASPPKYLAIFNYGIDDGTLVTQTWSAPQFGVTGYSGATTVGTVTRTGNTAVFNGTTVGGSPTYGVTGYSQQSDTSRVYKRAIVLDIYDYAKLRAGGPANVNAAQVFDAKLTSEGPCGSMAVVMDPMLGALFQDFPGENGKARTADVSLKNRQGC